MLNIQKTPVKRQGWDQRLAEERGFEPLRRCRPTRFRGESLQPLGYSSKDKRATVCIIPELDRPRKRESL